MHRKGFHCGSTAMGYALRLKGLDLPETLIFGLGAGLGFALYHGDTSLVPPQPGRFFVGRSATFERDLCEAVGAQLEERHFADAGEAWPHIAKLVSRSELPLVYTDLFHLPYVGARGHWFGHLVGIAAIRDGVASVADNEAAELKPCPAADLQKALCTDLPVRGEGCTVLHVSNALRTPPAGAARDAVLRNARRMTDDAAPGAGMLGLHALPQEIASWADRSDWQRCARLCAQAIEVRGSGGGLFRRVYAQFLEGAGFPELARLSRTAADAYSALASALEAARAENTPRLGEAVERAKRCAEAEEALWASAP
jgi:hypothetical protein